MNQIPEGWQRGVHPTPVPWKADGCRIESVACYPPDPGMMAGRPLLEIYDEGGHTEADAEFICRAVNAHDDLLKWAKAYRNDCFNNAMRNNPSADWVAFVRELDELIAKATAPAVGKEAAQ